MTGKEVEVFGWKRSPRIGEFFPDELKEYMEKHGAGTYTLLDVRQPFEYEESHLPGARLIPLPKLADSLGEIDRSRQIIVYCAAGGRSRTAARFLKHQGFEDVHHLVGGIEAWEDPTATGPVEFHLRFVQGDEGPAEIIQVAYQMEEGLRKFHETVLEKTGEEEFRSLLRSLIRAEEKHMETLSRLYGEQSQGERELRDSLGAGGEDLMEGGLAMREFLQANERFLVSISGFLELAMMIETQALDLYLRMAGESKNETTRGVLLTIAEEEKSHLGLLGRYMDQMGRR